jgi:hypothetical protein
MRPINVTPAGEGAIVVRVIGQVASRNQTLALKPRGAFDRDHASRADLEPGSDSDVKAGTLAAILKVAGITPEELRSLL